MTLRHQSGGEKFPLPLDMFEALFGDINFDDEGGAIFAGFDFNILPTASEHVCPNCKSINWSVDEQRGDYICNTCGCCDNNVYHESPTFTNNSAEGWGEREFEKTDGESLAPFFPENHDSMEPPEKQRKSVPSISTLVKKLPEELRDDIRREIRGATGEHKGKYERKFYYRERLRQWFMQEPPILEDDWEFIESAYTNYCDEELHCGWRIPTGQELLQSKGKAIEHCVILTKHDINIILQRAEDLKEENCKYDEPPPNCHYFLKKYGEKWLTIRWRFCGLASTARKAPKELLVCLLEDFEHLEEAFRQVVYDPLKRKAFPHYNTVIYHLLELYNCVHLGGDFPGLETRRAKKKIELYWWQMCKYLKWPYISKDADFLRKQLKK